MKTYSKIFLLIISLNTFIFCEDNDFKFAESLYENQDYYLAIFSYKRFIFFNPDDKKIPLSNFRIGLCYKYGKKYGDALDYFSNIVDKYPDTDLSKKSKFIIGLINYDSGDNQTAINIFDELYTTDPGYELAEQGQYLKGFSFLKKWDWEQANKSFNDFIKRYPDSKFKESALTLKIKTDNFEKKIPKKSPAFAGIISAILPGAGQIYSERITDAFSAFLWNLTLGYLTYNSYDKEVRYNSDPAKRDFTTTYTIGTIFGLFYLSNIYGAVNSAKNANFLIKVNFTYSAINQNSDMLRVILEQKF